MRDKKLCKSATDKIISGVCGGLGEYFGINSTLIRLGFAVFCAAGGSGILLYIVAAIIMPSEFRVAREEKTEFQDMKASAVDADYEVKE